MSISFQEVVLATPKVAEKAVNSKTIKVYPAEVSEMMLTKSFVQRHHKPQTQSPQIWSVTGMSECFYDIDRKNSD